MIKYNKTRIMLSAFTLCTFAFAGSAFAQKYKTAADTIKLNKEYSGVSLDIAKLNYKLIEAKNKTEGYKSKSASTAEGASMSAQESKSKSSTATNGNIDDAKRAMKQAKKANNQAMDAKNAMDEQNDNIKNIKDLNEKIEEKQQKLADLDKQKTAIKSQQIQGSIK